MGTPLMDTDLSSSELVLVRTLEAREAQSATTSATTVKVGAIGQMSATAAQKGEVGQAMAVGEEEAQDRHQEATVVERTQDAGVEEGTTTADAEMIGGVVRHLQILVLGRIATDAIVQDQVTGTVEDPQTAATVLRGSALQADLLLADLGDLALEEGKLWKGTN